MRRLVVEVQWNQHRHRMLQVKVTLLSLEESEGVQMSVSERVMVGGTVLTGRLVSGVPRSERVGASAGGRQACERCGGARDTARGARLAPPPPAAVTSPGPGPAAQRLFLSNSSSTQLSRSFHFPTTLGKQRILGWRTLTYVVSMFFFISWTPLWRDDVLISPLRCC